MHQVVVHVGGRELGRLAVGKPTRLVRRPGLLVSQAEIEGELRRRLGETAAGIGFPGVPLAERFLLADVRADLPLGRDSVAVWLDGEDMLAAFPLPGADRWRLMAPAPDPSADLGSDAVLAQLTELLALRSGFPSEVVREALWTSTFRFYRRLAETYRAGRVLLAGDAAHIHSPFGGQGLNTGIGDAENLAWKLALVCTGRTAPALLDSYEAERRPVAQDVLASTTGMTQVMLGGSAAARLVRDHQRLIWERSSQLLISYRGGPLAARTWLGTDSVARLAPESGAPATLDVLLVRPDAHLVWRGTDPGAVRR